MTSFSNETNPIPHHTRIWTHWSATSFRKDKCPCSRTKLSKLLKIREEACAAHELVRQSQIKWSKNNSPPFSKGDLVWLDGRHLNKGHKFPKIDALQEGPFKIQEVMGPVTYKLRLPPQWKIHDVFHGKTLTPCHETEVHGKNFPEPPPDLINGEEEFEVDSIWDHQKRGKGHLYLVRWKGYPDETWEPERNLKNSSEILEEYKRRKKLQWFDRQSSNTPNKPDNFSITNTSNMSSTLFDSASFSAALLFIEKIFNEEKYIHTLISECKNDLTLTLNLQIILEAKQLELQLTTKEKYWNLNSVRRSSSLGWKKDRNRTEPNCKRPDHRLRLHKFWIFSVASCDVCRKI